MESWRDTGNATESGGADGKASRRRRDGASARVSLVSPSVFVDFAVRGGVRRGKRRELTRASSTTSIPPCELLLCLTEVGLCLIPAILAKGYGALKRGWDIPVEECSTTLCTVPVSLVTSCPTGDHAPFRSCQRF